MKLAVLVLVALLGFGSASAQRNGGRRKMSVEQQVSNLKKELNLTDEQTEKWTKKMRFECSFITVNMGLA